MSLESVVPQEVEISSLPELAQWCQEALQEFSPRTIVLLTGEMGAGKTEAVRAFLGGLGSAEVSSPSFALHHVYPTTKGDVDHVDLYRLETLSELEGIGFWDLFSKKTGLVFIEWANKIDYESLPPHWWKIEIHLSKMDQDKNTRLLKIRREAPLS